MSQKSNPYAPPPSSSLPRPGIEKSLSFQRRKPGAKPGLVEVLELATQEHRSATAHANRPPAGWCTFPKLTVRYAFGRRLTFCGLKRYITVGQLRELVAAQLYLPAACVGLEIGEYQLLINSMTLEDALEGRIALNMSYVSPGSQLYPYTGLCGVTVHSRVRRLFIRLVEWPWFDRISLLLIGLNAILMMASDPLYLRRGPVEYLNAWTDPIITVLFTIEMCAPSSSNRLQPSHRTVSGLLWPHPRV